MEEAPSSSLPSSLSPLLAAATMLKAIIEAANAEKAQSFHVDEIAHREYDNTEKEEQQRRTAHQATTNPHALSRECRPLRRPGRPLRKRGRRAIHFSSKGCHAHPSSLENQPLRNTVAGLGGGFTWRENNGTNDGNIIAPPHAPLLPSVRASALGRGRIQMDQGRPWGGEQLGTAAFSSDDHAAVSIAGAGTAAAVSVAVAALASAAAAASGDGTVYARQTVNSLTVSSASASSSSSLPSPPSARRERLPPSLPPASPSPSCLASSVTRLISSETYLRRLFVTAPLAHVLSLDTCVPRSMPVRRKASSRVRGAGGHDAECNEEEGGNALRGEQQDGGAGGNSDGAAGGNNANTNNAEIQGHLNAAFEQPTDSGPFTKAFPVTLIDSGGQRWSVMFVTTTRDNVLSGRLVDGWDKFCSANGLKIGDSVEFTRLEAHELSFQGVEHGREAIAKVAAYKKRRRNQK